ncbi:unnamed protein product [Calicophoron daubneyi]|uniref:Protein phosphatase 1 regulatory subunit 16A n=1 Tax=Calicophoron daubneyi TaxID=300641 RepID=A0AAV2TLA1_CALDB
MTNIVLRPPSVDDEQLQKQQQRTRINMERLEAAKRNRQKQLERWHEYEIEMEENEDKRGGFHASSGQKKVEFKSKFILLDAALRDDVEEVRYLLRRGVDPNVARDDGQTALHLACINGNSEMCELLLARGANVNSRDRDKWTPLHTAASHSQTEICELLLSRGADILATDVDGSTPYDFAEDQETTDLFLEEMRSRGIYPADVAEARSKPEKEMLDDLMECYHSGGNINQLDSQGAAPIHVAACCGYQEVARLLLRSGVDPDTLDADSWTPSHVAAYWAQVEVLEILVAYEADLTKQTPDGDTVFSLCESPDVQEKVSEIWENRANLQEEIRNEKGRSSSKRLLRKRSASSVHRTSMRDKANLARRAIQEEMDILIRSERDNSNGWMEDSPMAPKKPNNPSPEPRKIILVYGQNANDSQNSATPGERRPVPAGNEDRQPPYTIRPTRPPTGYEYGSPDVRDGDSAYRPTVRSQIHDASLSPHHRTASEEHRPGRIVHITDKRGGTTRDHRHAKSGDDFAHTERRSSQPIITIHSRQNRGAIEAVQDDDDDRGSTAHTRCCHPCAIS